MMSKYPLDKPGLPNQERSSIPDSILKIVYLPLSCDNIIGPDNLLNQEVVLIYAKLIPGIRELQAPRPDNVRDFRRGVIPFEVWGVSMSSGICLSVSGYYGPPRYLGTTRETESSFAIRDNNPVKSSVPFDNQILIGIFGQVWIGTELSDLDRTRQSREKQDQKKDGPAHNKRITNVQLINMVKCIIT